MLAIGNTPVTMLKINSQSMEKNPTIIVALSNHYLPFVAIGLIVFPVLLLALKVKMFSYNVFIT